MCNEFNERDDISKRISEYFQAPLALLESREARVWPELLVNLNIYLN